MFSKYQEARRIQIEASRGGESHPVVVVAPVAGIPAQVIAIDIAIAIAVAIDIAALFFLVFGSPHSVL